MMSLHVRCHAAPQMCAWLRVSVKHHTRMRTVRQSRRLLVVAACVVLAVPAAWIAYRHLASRATPAPPARGKPIPAPAEVQSLVSSARQPASAPIALSGTSSPQPPLATTPDLIATWTFKNALEGNALDIKTVSQVPAGLLVDATSGQVLWSKNYRQKMEIASMTKMMTLLLALEAIKAGALALDTKVVVSKSAALIGGSQVFLKQGEVFTMGELLKSVVIKSANDSAELVAETVSGDAAAFVKRMNGRAHELGMTQTAFYNVHGLNVGQRNTSTALDMALLARELLKHPLVLQWSSTRIDTFRNGTFQLKNSNPLVGVVKGVDGLKTGYYRQAGFCITFTVQRDGVRLIGVVIGVQNKAARATFCKEAIEWGYQRSAKKGK